MFFGCCFFLDFQILHVLVFLLSGVRVFSILDITILQYWKSFPAAPACRPVCSSAPLPPNKAIQQRVLKSSLVVCLRQLLGRVFHDSLELCAHENQTLQKDKAVRDSYVEVLGGRYLSLPNILRRWCPLDPLNISRGRCPSNFPHIPSWPWWWPRACGSGGGRYGGDSGGAQGAALPGTSI